MRDASYAGGVPATCSLCDFSTRLTRLSDTGVILDIVLGKARELGRADAGTIYLVEDGRLVFSYTQNDTLFPGSAANKYVYLNASLPIDTASVSGYAAVTRQTLHLADVYRLPPGAPYLFNNSFDWATGYRTVSILAVPLLDGGGRLLGVLQLINHLDAAGAPAPFSAGEQASVERLASLAEGFIERGRMARELIMRMLAVSALRDPHETASHVMRVGALAAEIYHRWAEKREVPPETLRDAKGNIRMAAMLHDVGKVGIPDAVLKKPGRLTPEERAVMEEHCAMGARLFDNATSDMDLLARDIAQHHHQKWDGSGYTGSAAVPSLSGEDIPLVARITAVADVYDALVSRRSYKEGWSAEDAVRVLTADAGSHFDPAVVEAFMEIRDVAEAVHDRYPDEPDRTTA